MNLNTNWELRVRDAVYKSLSKFPSDDRGRIARTIEDLSLNPFAGDIEKMDGEERTWRRRIGNYRIFYELIPEDRVIYVFRAERRTSSTY